MRQLCGRCRRMKRMAPFKYEECSKCSKRERSRRVPSRRTLVGFVQTEKGLIPYVEGN